MFTFLISLSLLYRIIISLKLCWCAFGILGAMGRFFSDFLWIFFCLLGGVSFGTAVGASGLAMSSSLLQQYPPVMGDVLAHGRFRPRGPTRNSMGRLHF